MNSPQATLSPWTNSLKSKFTEGFLRALLKINRQRSVKTGAPTCLNTSTSTAPSSETTFRKYYRVRSAADKSLAFAVGSRRAWSRAMINRIRNQTRKRQALIRKIKLKEMKKKKKKKKKAKKMCREEFGGFGQANELRKLVPGGKAMDLCCLLDETAHYIKCLDTQVQVMRNIADFFSTG